MTWRTMASNYVIGVLLGRNVKDKNIEEIEFSKFYEKY